MSNIFAVYKPKGPTSRQVLNEIQKITGERCVGHAGTLDPLASGVLVVGVGREATKKLDAEVKKEKEYIAKVKLGETSTTDDEEGEKNRNVFLSHGGTALRAEAQPRFETCDKKDAAAFYLEIKSALKNFIGKIQQIPPVYSAIKIKGQEAYKRVRKGETVEMKPREVEIKSIEILEYQYPFLTIKVVTGPGVYIRSLARDIGEKLGVGGYLADLERIRVGDFKKEDAIPFEQIGKQLSF